MDTNQVHEKKVIVSVSEWLPKNKQLNLHITVGLLSFMFMVFHFTSVYFFTLQLESLMLVGIFLGLGNLFAFLFDVPIGILQYYFKPKHLYAFGVLAQIVAMLIFWNFIFSVTDFLSGEIAEYSWKLESVVKFFLQDGLNLVLMIVAAFCYGFSKEVNDITTISYVLNSANPDQYKQIIAKNNLSIGIGAFFGLVISGIVLTANPKFIIFHIVFMIMMVFYFVFKFFDSSEKVFDIDSVKNFHLSEMDISFDSTTQKMSQVVRKVDIAKTLQNTKFLILLPAKISGKAPWVGELSEKTIESFKEIWETLKYSRLYHLIVYWSFIMLLFFGFWDTFATTFLIDYLNQVKSGWSFILLGIIAVPAYWLQSLFGTLSDKYGSYQISLIGLALSAGSLIFMSIFGGDKNIYVVMGAALVNSVGYAICMSLSVATFLESYNVSYAEKKSLKQIDANASAAPMKILQNLANVVGLMLGWMVLGVAGFRGFFFVFGASIAVFLAWSIWRKKLIVQK